MGACCGGGTNSAKVLPEDQANIQASKSSTKQIVAQTRVSEKLRQAKAVLLRNVSLNEEFRSIKQRDIDKEVMRRVLSPAGVCSEDRLALWCDALGVGTELSAVEAEHGAYFRELSMQTNAKVEKEIRNDIGRTFPEHEWFQSSQAQESLFNVLFCAAIALPDVAYVQGMNFIAGFFLLQANEHNELQAFLMFLSYLTQKKFNMQRHYGVGLTALLATMKAMDVRMASELPDLHKHLAGLSMPSVFFGTPYFLTFFCYNIPDHSVLVRVWDYLLIQPTIRFDERKSSTASQHDSNTNVNPEETMEACIMRLVFSYLRMVKQDVLREGTDIQAVLQILKNMRVDHGNLLELLHGGM
jgi:hypothetical protein